MFLISLQKMIQFFLSTLVIFVQSNVVYMFGSSKDRKSESASERMQRKYPGEPRRGKDRLIRSPRRRSLVSIEEKILLRNVYARNIGNVFKNKILTKSEIQYGMRGMLNANDGWGSGRRNSIETHLRETLPPRFRQSAAERKCPL